MATWVIVTLAAAVVTAGLLAGLFHTWATGIVLGLDELDDRSFVAAFAAINRRMINGWFAPVFAGPGILLLASGIGVLGGSDRRAFGLLAGAFVGWLLVVLLTAGVHLPLNNRIDAVVRAGADPTEVRRLFRSRWVRWNALRTAVACAAFIAAVGALVVAS